MNSHLPEPPRPFRPPESSAATPLGQAPRPRHGRWRVWAAAAAALFAVYVFIGPFFIKEEYQWRVIYSKATGKGEAAYIRETIPAKTEEAGAVTSATKNAEVAPEIAKAAGIAQAQVAPTLETEAGKAIIEVVKATQLANIDVETSYRKGRVQIEQAERALVIEAYQRCQNDARNAAAIAAASNDNLAAAQAAGAIVFAQKSALCDQHLTDRDALRAEAASAVSK